MKPPKCPVCAGFHWSTKQCPKIVELQAKKPEPQAAAKEKVEKNTEIIESPEKISRRLAGRERARVWRDRHREKYNKKMLVLMRKERAKARKRKKFETKIKENGGGGDAC